jgi:DNA-binding protein HU-beta
MSKKNLIRDLAETTGVSQKDIKKVMEVLPLLLAKELLEEGRVGVPGICSVTIRERKERNGVNPQTGAPIKIAARKVAAFKPAKGFPF